MRPTPVNDGDLLRKTGPERISTPKTVQVWWREKVGNEQGPRRKTGGSGHGFRLGQVKCNRTNGVKYVYNIINVSKSSP